MVKVCEVRNKNGEYKRETPIAVINAKDVEKPETLKNPKASCLIKMTNPSFEAFKLAFQDSESRVRLNSDVSEKFYSRIESLSITGGYLDGLHIDFSEHLNSVVVQVNPPCWNAFATLWNWSQLAKMLRSNIRKL